MEVVEIEVVEIEVVEMVEVVEVVEVVKVVEMEAVGEQKSRCFHSQRLRMALGRRRRAWCRHSTT